MHPVDVETSLKSMTIYVDTRERPTEQSRRRYAEFGCPWENHKLNVGDYSCAFVLPNGETYSLENEVCVERKLGFAEMCMCFTHERGRFTREFERAKEADTRLYLLIENSSWELAYAGNYRSQMKPQALIASMLAWMARYDCRIIMCKAETSGHMIHDVLYREAKERLTALEL